MQEVTKRRVVLLIWVINTCVTNEMIDDMDKKNEHNGILNVLVDLMVQMVRRFCMYNYIILIFLSYSSVFISKFDMCSQV